MKDVAWLEDAQLSFLIFHTFVFKFAWVDKCLDAVRGKKIYQQRYGKLKNSSATYRKATSFKLSECNFLPSILTFWFTNCEKFYCGLLSDSHTNTVISDCFAYLSRWRWKPWLGLLAFVPVLTSSPLTKIGIICTQILQEEKIFPTIPGSVQWSAEICTKYWETCSKISCNYT